MACTSYLNVNQGKDNYPGLRGGGLLLIIAKYNINRKGFATSHSLYRNSVDIFRNDPFMPVSTFIFGKNQQFITHIHCTVS